MSKLAAIYGTTTEHVDDWRERAACRSYHPETWFAKENTKEEATAVSICRGCDVRGTCLREALDENIRHGVWGGMTEAEREKIRTARRRRNSQPWPLSLPHDGGRTAANEHRKRGQESCAECVEVREARSREQDRLAAAARRAVRA